MFYWKNWVFDEHILKRVKFLQLSHQATELPNSVFFQNVWEYFKVRMDRHSQKVGFLGGSGANYSIAHLTRV